MFGGGGAKRPPSRIRVKQKDETHSCIVSQSTLYWFKLNRMYNSVIPYHAIISSSSEHTYSGSVSIDKSNHEFDSMTMLP